MRTGTFFPLGRHAVAIVAAALLGACAGAPAAELLVERFDDAIVVDGRLDEACYRREPRRGGFPLDRFVVASAPDRSPPPTRAWLFWNEERLVVAFDCEDRDVVARPESGREHDVDAQDRVELFLWSGRAEDSYACIEIGARGALHEYRARFHRRFDDSWSATGLEHAVTATPAGYRVEAVLPCALMRELGFPLAAGTTLRAGLFRADFRSEAPDAPTWITWVDANLAAPDFHVAASFGTLRLVPARPATPARAVER
jgi:cellulose/xylan binding protein with CBM9 domain